MDKPQADILKPAKPRSDREKKAILTKIAYKRVFGSGDGKLVLLDLMNSAGLLHTTYDPQNPNPVNNMLVAEGRREIVLRILTELNVDLETYLIMFDEAEEASVYADEQ